MTYERDCTRHAGTSYEAETFSQGSLNYIMLRCPQCHRPQGQRLVRRRKT